MISFNNLYSQISQINNKPCDIKIELTANSAVHHPMRYNQNSVLHMHNVFQKRKFNETYVLYY